MNTRTSRGPRHALRVVEALFAFYIELKFILYAVKGKISRYILQAFLLGIEKSSLQSYSI